MPKTTGAESFGEKAHRKQPLPPERKKRSASVWLAPGDEEAVKFIAEKLGITDAEAIRTAIRVYHALLNQ